MNILYSNRLFEKKKNYILAKLEFWSLNYLDSITLVPWLKFDLFWPLNFSLLHILVLSVSFNSKTLGFLHFLLKFFWDSCCWRLMEMIWRWKRGEENEENLTFFVENHGIIGRKIIDVSKRVSIRVLMWEILIDIHIGMNRFD